MSSESAKEIEQLEKRIEDLKRRIPAHSVHPVMLQELEDLEEELATARAAEKDA